MSDKPQAPAVWWDRATNVVITDAPSWPAGTFTPEDAVQLVPAVAFTGEQPPAPVDWPARFRAAAQVADAHALSVVARRLNDLGAWAERNHWPEAVEAVGRALLGGQP